MKINLARKNLGGENLRGRDWNADEDLIEVEHVAFSSAIGTHESVPDTLKIACLETELFVSSAHELMFSRLQDVK